MTEMKEALVFMFPKGIYFLNILVTNDLNLNTPPQFHILFSLPSNNYTHQESQTICSFTRY